MMEEYVWISKATDIEIFTTHSHPIMHRLGQEWGVKVTIAGSDGLDLKDEPYIKAIYDAIERKVAGILVHGWGVPAEVEAINAAVEQGIPVITVDSDVPTSKRLAHVGTEWFRMGAAMADQIAGLIGNKGKVLYMGNETLANIQTGFRGFQNRMSAYPDIELILAEDHFSMGADEAIATDYLNKYPDISGIAGFESHSGTGIARALEKLGLAGKVKVVCVDAEAEHIHYIKNGTIQVAFAQRRELFTYLAFQMLYSYNHGSAATGYIAGPGNISGNIDTGFTIVMKWNVESFTDEFNLEETVERIKLTRQLSLMSTVLKSSGQMTFAVDANQSIAYANPIAIKLAQVPEEEIIGFTLSQIFNFSEENRFAIEQCIRTGLPSTFETMTRKSIPVQVTITNLKTETVKGGLVVIATDITERKQAEAIVQQSEEQLRQAVQIGNIGIFDHDHVANNLYWSPELRQIFNIAPDETVSLATLLAHSNPADRDNIAKTIQQAHDPTGDGLFDMEYRFIDSTGAVRWIRNRSQTLFEGEGSARHPVRTIGAALDITEQKRAEVALRESEQRYRTLVENSPDFILILDKDYRIQYINRVSVWNSVANVIGTEIFDFILPEYVDTVRNTFANVISTGKPGQFEIQINNIRGSTFWLDTRVAPIFEGNVVTSFMLVSTDTTERKRIAKILRSSESRYRTIVETAQEGIWLIDNQAITTYVNPKMAEILGYKPTEMLDHSLFDFMDETMHEQAQENLKRRAQGIKEQHEFCFKHKSGKDVWVSISTNAIMGEHGEYIAALAMVTDITKQKQAALEMHEQKQFLQFVLDNIPSRVFWKDINSTFLGGNRLFAQDIGVNSTEEIVGKDDYYPSWATLADKYRAEDRQVMESGIALLNYEEPHMTPNGEKGWLQTSKVPLKDANGKLIGILGTYQDITERKRMEQDLLLTQFSVDHASIGIMRSGGDAKILSVNQHYCQLVGYTADELYKMHIYDLDPDYPYEKWLERRAYIRLHGSGTIETTHRHKNGTYIPLEITSTYVSFQGNDYSVSFIRDMTERNKILEALRINSFAVERSSDAVYWIDENTLITGVNEAASHMTGYSRSELIGQSITLIDALKTQDEMLARLKLLKDDGSFRFETKHKTKDGHVFPVEVVINHVSYGGKELNCAFVRDITERKQAEEALKKSETLLNESQQSAHIGSWEQDIPTGKLTWSDEAFRLFGFEPHEIDPIFDLVVKRVHTDDLVTIQNHYQETLKTKNFDPLSYRVVLPDGNIRWILNTGTVLLNETGEPIRFLGMVQDITERKRAELDKQESEQMIKSILDTIPTRVFWKDKQYRLMGCNQKFVDDAGVTSAAELIGKSDEDVLAASDVPWNKQAVQYRTDDRQVIEKGLSLIGYEEQQTRADGKTYWVRTTKMPLKNMQGDVVGLLGAYEDITERKLSELALQAKRQEEQQFQHYLKVLHEITRELTTTETLNQLYQQTIKLGLEKLGFDRMSLWLYDAKQNKAIGTFGTDTNGNIQSESHLQFVVEPHGDMWTAMQSPDRFYYAERAKLGHNLETVGYGWNVTIALWQGNRHLGWLAADNLIHGRPISQPELDILAQYGMFIAATLGRKQIESALRESEFFLQKSQMVGHVGSYYLDAINGEWISSPILDEIFGIDEDFKKDLTGWASLLHPDDKAEMLPYLNEYVLAKHNRFDKEYRILRHNNQQERWVYGIGELEFDDKGNVVKMIGTIQDITERKQTETILQESQQRFQKIFQSSPIAISVSRLSDSVIVDINEAAVEILGYSREELIGNSHLKLSTWGGPVERERIARIFREKGRVSNHEIQVPTKSGEPRTLLLSIEPLELAGQIYFLTSSIDITDRKRVEAALQASETRLRQAIRVGNIGIFDHNHLTNEVYYSPELRAIYGWTQDEEVPFSKTPNQIYFEDRAKANEAAKQVANPAGDGVSDLEFRIMHHTDSIRWVSIRSQTFFEGEGINRHPVRTIGAIANITETKRAEEALRESEKNAREFQDKLKTLQEISFELSAIDSVDKLCARAIELGHELLDYDRLGMSVFENADFSEGTNYGIDEHGGLRITRGLQVSNDDITVVNVMKNPNATFVSEDTPLHNEVHKAVGKGWNVVTGLWGRNNSLGWLAADNFFRQKPLLPYQIELLKLYGITIGHLIVSKRAEAALQASEERLRQAVRTGNIGIFDHDHIIDKIYWSPEQRRIYGFPSDEIVTIESIANAIHPYDLPYITEANLQSLDPAGDGNFDVECRITDRSGATRWLNVRSQTFFTADPKDRRPIRTIGATTDITEYAQQQEALMRYNQRLSILRDIDRVILSAKSPHEIVVLVIERLAKLIPSESIKIVLYDEDISHEQVFAWQPNKDIKVDVQNPKAVVSNPILDRLKSGESTVTPDLSLVDGDLSKLANELVAEGIGAAMAIPLIIHKKLMGVLALASKEAGFFTGEHQEIAETVANQVAIALHQAELNERIAQHNSELEQRVAERTKELQEANEEIKSFAYIVSHDLRAPLVNLKGFAAELRSSLKIVKEGCDELLPTLNTNRRESILQALQLDIPEALQYIESSVSNMDSFTKAILKLSRLGRLQLELVNVDIKAIVEKRLETLGYQINQQNVKVIVGNLPMVTADTVSMEQIFGNILTNAVAYLVPNRPGEIEITAWSTPVETIFRIRDNGRGIAKEDMDKVFAPFRRAGRQDVPGEGMGLAYVQTLVRRHGGRIWCESTLNVGTTFCFTISNHLQKEGAE